MYRDMHKAAMYRYDYA